jgi:glycosyltransferase involved in cell wall biosynthesis
VIVVDDGSSDRSLEFIKRFGASLLWESISNIGACGARNRGLDLATSDFVIFLDADDYMEGNLVGSLVEAASAGAADLAFATLVRESPSGGRGHPLSYPSTATAKDLLLGWLKGDCIGNGATIWRRSFLESIGRWNEDIMQGQDVELVIRALTSGASVAFATEGTLVYCDHQTVSRISKRVSEPILRNRLCFMLGLLARADQSDKEVRAAFAYELYLLAKRAATSRCRSVSGDALMAARKLGLRGYPGSMMWRAACAMAGFSNVAPFAAKARSLQAKFSRSAR